MPQPRDARHPGQARFAILLPIDPPEIDAGILDRPVRRLEIGFHVRFAAGIELRHRILGRIQTKLLHEFGIALLVGADAIVRMGIERDLDAILAEIGQQFFGIGQELAVPGPARPAQHPGMTDAGLGLPDRVPAHVHHHDVERKIMLAVAADQIAEILFGVVFPAAVPGAKDMLARNRTGTGHHRQRPQGRRIIVAIAKQIPVDAAIRRPAGDPAIDQNRLAAIIDQMPAIARQQAFGQRHRPANAIERRQRPA